MIWSKDTVSDDMKRWIEECFEWFDERFPPPRGPVLPTKEFFKAPGGSDEATARQVLDDVLRIMNFSHPIDILPLDSVPAEYKTGYQELSEAAGYYSEEDGSRLIQYNPVYIHKPVMFIGLLAHEVMHARLAGMEDEVPGGPEAHELATDLGCIIAGFGVFQLQAADDAGWLGYMTQPSRAHAFAVFLERRGLGPDVVEAHLAKRPRKLLRQAIKST